MTEIIFLSQYYPCFNDFLPLNYYVVKIFLYVVVFITHVRSFTVCGQSQCLLYTRSFLRRNLFSLSYLFRVQQHVEGRRKRVNNTLVFASHFIGNCPHGFCRFGSKREISRPNIRPCLKHYDV